MTTFFLVIGAIALVYLVILIRIYTGQSRRIFRPLKELIATPEAQGLDYEDVRFRTEDGLCLHGWFLPKSGARHVLLFFHGNTRNISHCVDSAALFHRLGFSTLLFDYRGYGHSEGRPTEAGTYLDAEAAWFYLVETRGIDPEHIVLMGRSLGAAIASWLAARHTPKALVIESTFTSLPEVAADLHPYLPVRWLARHHYPVAKNLKKVSCPVLIVHSPEDELIAYRHGRTLYELANEPREFLDIKGRHYDGHAITGTTYTEGLEKFFQRYLDHGTGHGSA